MQSILDGVLCFPLILHAQVLFPVITEENAAFDFECFVLLSGEDFLLLLKFLLLLLRLNSLKFLVLHSFDVFESKYTRIEKSGYIFVECNLF